MKLLLVFSIIASLYLFPDYSFSSDGDVISIVTHNKTWIVTDPQKGFNAYKTWSLFPTNETKYRKAELKITYQCPDSQKCGEWDYIDNIFLRRKGSINDTSLDIELARMISPYGSRFTPDWKFTWKTDVTDFSFLLHDSVEIEFNHTGYESNNDRGWVITIEFELTEGAPTMETLGFLKLWNGSFPYGNINDDIENYLIPITFNGENADIARVRILQTGHGMDEQENCAEFCSKFRSLYFDDKLIEQKQIWLECADNPLYPQAGTWIFDRANWCPGSMVKPDIYDFELNDTGIHSINMDMESYSNPGKPSANYVFSSYLFFYKNPELLNDVSLEDIIAPGRQDIYLRKNPICFEPAIVIKNNGKNNLRQLKINYGIEGEAETLFNWTGNIKSGKFFELSLPFVFSGNRSENRFKVTLTFPNGEEDEYKPDNSGTSDFILPPVFDNEIIITFRTNNDSSDNYYQLKNSNGQILNERIQGTLKPNKIYRDAFNLSNGCYEFVFGDTADNGLDFWFHPEGGYGYVRITDLNGKLIKAYNSDFGKEIRQQFMVNGSKSVKDNTPVLNIFPIRNPGKFFCDIFLNEKQNVKIQITTEDKKKTIYEKKLKSFKEGMVNIDLSKAEEGLYFVNLIAGDTTVTRKMKIKRD